MRDYSKTSIEQLRRHWRNLDENTSAMTLEDECRRMAAMEAISAEFQRRGEPLPQ